MQSVLTEVDTHALISQSEAEPLLIKSNAHTLSQTGAVFFTSSHHNHVDTKMLYHPHPRAYERDYNDELYGSLTDSEQ